MQAIMSPVEGGVNLGGDVLREQERKSFFSLTQNGSYGGC